MCAPITTTSSLHMNCIALLNMKHWTSQCLKCGTQILSLAIFWFVADFYFLFTWFSFVIFRFSRALFHSLVHKHKHTHPLSLGFNETHQVRLYTHIYAFFVLVFMFRAFAIPLIICMCLILWCEFGKRFLNIETCSTFVPWLCCFSLPDW